MKFGLFWSLACVSALQLPKISIPALPTPSIPSLDSLTPPSFGSLTPPAPPTPPPLPDGDLLHLAARLFADAERAITGADAANYATVVAASAAATVAVALPSLFLANGAERKRRARLAVDLPEEPETPSFAARIFLRRIAATPRPRIFRGDTSRRRGCDLENSWRRVAATPRRFGRARARLSTSRRRRGRDGGIFRGDTSRRGRGRDVGY